jgi:hypothetical protein
MTEGVTKILKDRRRRPGGKVNSGRTNQIEPVRESIHGEEKLSEKI